ncbi:MAG: Pr6Pr family membrane protein, partial [Actinomycetes bacterium]
AFVAVTMCAASWVADSPQSVVDMGGGRGSLSDFEAWYSRLATTFFYFTNSSNLIVAITCLLLAIRLNRSSALFRVFRLYSLIAIIITGLVYNFYIAQVHPSSGFNLVINILLHSVVPVMSVGGWLAFGPRTPFRFSYLLGSVSIGLVWLVITLSRGAIIHWYPYPFLDAGSIGLGDAIRNCSAVLICALLIGLAILGLDTLLPPRASRRQPSAVDPTSPDHGRQLPRR